MVDQLLLSVKVTPNAARSGIAGWRDDVLQLKIAAPPEKGKANRELIDFLSGALGVKKADIAIVRGLTDRRKTVAVAGMSREELINRLKGQS